MVGRAAHRGRNGTLAGTPVYDPLIAHLRYNVTGRTLIAWDLVVPASHRLVPDPVAGRALAAALADAGHKVPR
jgi:hypothetical protein